MGYTHVCDMAFRTKRLVVVVARRRAAARPRWFDEPSEKFSFEVYSLRMRERVLHANGHSPLL